LHNSQYKIKTLRIWFIRRIIIIFKGVNRPIELGAKRTSQNVDEVKQILDALPDKNFPLHYVIENAYKNQEIIHNLIIIRGANVNLKNKKGKTPLHLASEKGFEENCQSLIHHGADVDARDNNGKTPMHWAAWNGKEKICKLFLQNKADCNAQDNYGETPLHKASYHGHENVCSLLLQHGADRTIIDNESRTAADMAKLSKSFHDDDKKDRIVRLLN